MGYNTDFSGKLTFNPPLTITSLAKLNEILDDDLDDYPIDLEVSRDCSGLVWNGAEKSRYMVEHINQLIQLMREDFPDFGLEGYLDAAGDDTGDIWRLQMVDGVAVKKTPRIVYDE